MKKAPDTFPIPFPIHLFQYVLSKIMTSMKLILVILVILVFIASACQEGSQNVPTILQDQTTLKDNLATQLSGFWSGTSGDDDSDSTKCYWYLDLDQSGDFKLSVSYSNTAKQDHLSGTWYVSDHLLFLLPSNAGTYLFPIVITSEDREQGGYYGYPATIREVEKDRVELFFHCVDLQGLDHLLLARRIKSQEPIANELD